MEERIRIAVAKALEGADASGVTFTVERPTESARGDYATNAAMAAASRKKNPRELALELAKRIRDALGADAKRVEVAGPGFINITLSKEAVAFAVATADAKGEEWGRAGSQEQTGRRVMVEYTDPNPFKEMHIGHLMSNTIGEAVARLIENEGALVKRANYQGDVGPHVAKALWGLRDAGVAEPADARELGKAYAHGAQAYEHSPKAKEEIDAINRAVYAGTNPELAELWRKGREVSLSAFEEIYRRLGTKFDYYFFESETAAPGMEIVRDGLTRGVFEKSDLPAPGGTRQAGGAVIYRGEKKGLHTRVFITAHGTPTYEAKEIGLAFLKEKRWSADRSLILTAHEQVGHFEVVNAALEEIAPLLAKKTTHIAHGFLKLASGKMSSREGNVITAAALLQEVIEKAREKNADPVIAEAVAVGALKFMALRQAPGSDIVFDPEKSLSLEGDSGPYLQYALVRAKKILSYDSAGEGNEVPEAPYPLERLILHYPEVAARAARELAPNLLVSYLLELAGAWNSFYAKEQILGSPEEAYKQRVTRAFSNTMANGLKLLGIPAPEKM